MARTFFFFFDGRKWLLKAVAYVELNPVRAGMVNYITPYRLPLTAFFIFSSVFCLSLAVSSGFGYYTARIWDASSFS